MKMKNDTLELENYLNKNATKLKSTKENLSTYIKSAAADDEKRKIKSKKLQSFRKNKLGLTQSELANAVGANLRTLQSWERGRQSMPKSIEILIDLMVEMPAVRKKLINKKAA